MNTTQPTERKIRSLVDVVNAAAKSAAAAAAVAATHVPAVNPTAKAASLLLTASAVELTKAAQAAVEEVSQPTVEGAGDGAMPKADPLPSNTGTPAKQIGPVLDDAEDEQAVKAAAAVFEKYASSLNLLRQVDSATIIGFISSKSASAVTDEELAQLEEPEAAAVADFADETMGGAEQDAIESADAVANYLSEQGIEEEGAVGEEMPMEGEEPLNPEDNPDVAELLLALEEAGISPEELFTEDPMAKAASAVWEELPLRQKAAAIVGLMVRNAAPKVTQAIRKGV